MDVTSSGMATPSKAAGGLLSGRTSPNGAAFWASLRLTPGLSGGIFGNDFALPKSSASPAGYEEANLFELSFSEDGTGSERGEGDPIAHDAADMEVDDCSRMDTTGDRQTSSKGIALKRARSSSSESGATIKRARLVPQETGTQSSSSSSSSSTGSYSSNGFGYVSEQEIGSEDRLKTPSAEGSIASKKGKRKEAPSDSEGQVDALNSLMFSLDSLVQLPSSSPPGSTLFPNSFDQLALFQSEQQYLPRPHPFSATIVNPFLSSISNSILTGPSGTHSQNPSNHAGTPFHVQTRPGAPVNPLPARARSGSNPTASPTIPRSTEKDRPNQMLASKESPPLSQGALAKHAQTEKKKEGRKQKQKQAKGPPAAKRGKVQRRMSSASSESGSTSSATANLTASSRQLQARPIHDRSLTDLARVSDSADQTDESKEDSSSKEGGSRGYGTVQEPERRHEHLERNRVAACKSRIKKKEWISNLETAADELTIKNGELQLVVNELRNEVESLRNLIRVGHDGCACGLVKKYWSCLEVERDRVGLGAGAGSFQSHLLRHLQGSASHQSSVSYGRQGEPVSEGTSIDLRTGYNITPANSSSSASATMSNEAFGLFLRNVGTPVTRQARDPTTKPRNREAADSSPKSDVSILTDPETTADSKSAGAANLSEQGQNSAFGLSFPQAHDDEAVAAFRELGAGSPSAASSVQSADDVPTLSTVVYSLSSPEPSPRLSLMDEEGSPYIQMI